MRRPLKPFVTEYKQSNRRNTTEISEPITLEAQRPAQKTNDFAFNEPDDSYEAAMRAADALFSPSAKAQQDSQSAETRTTDLRLPLSEEAQKPEKNGGRILRVIDEEPLPQYAALEAARAPKRRGRKPGSKNKPKVALVAAEVTPVERQARPATVVAFPTRPPGTPQPPASEIDTIQAAPRPAKRALWGRDRVRPGEDWKRRRLPKVCW